MDFGIKDGEADHQFMFIKIRYMCSLYVTTVYTLLGSWVWGQVWCSRACVDEGSMCRGYVGQLCRVCTSVSLRDT